MTSSDPDAPARFVLDFLIARHPSLLTVDELVCEFAGSAGESQKTRAYIDDGLAELMGSGLVHRLEDFVFASRAAMRASDLAL
jgi:hypothetical protein